MNGLIALLILIVVVGVVWYLLNLVIGMAPMDATFKKIASILLALICVLVILSRALPLIGIQFPI